MIDSILAYLGTSYVICVLAAVAFLFYRECGAAAVAGFGHCLVGAGSSSWGASSLNSQPSCDAVVAVVAALPALLFALVPKAYLELTRRRVRNTAWSEFLLLWTMLFTASAANIAAIAALSNSPISPAAGGAFWLAVLSGSASFACATSRDTAQPRTATGGAGSDTNPPAMVQPAATLPGLRLVSSLHPPARLHQSEPSVSGEFPAQSPPVLRGSGVLGSTCGSGTSYLFNKNEFFIFRQDHIQALEDLLCRQPPGVLEGLHSAICTRLGRPMIDGDERAFLRAYVEQFRRRLEHCYPAFGSNQQPELLVA